MNATAAATSVGTLEITTPSDREIAMTRIFDAPRHLVFDAYTKPELFKRWLGPRGWSLTVANIDLKVGGRYRMVGRGQNGPDMGWGGVYREIVPSERLVVTERFDQPWYPGEALVTTQFLEQDGRTTLTTTVRYESQDARDGVLRTPMVSGVEQSYERLSELLMSLQAEQGSKVPK